MSERRTKSLRPSMRCSRIPRRRGSSITRAPGTASGPRRRTGHVPHRPCSCGAHGGASRWLALTERGSTRPPMGDLRSMAMPVGVLDIGSNTIRLLVARVETAAIVPLDGGRVRLPLGEEIEREGRLSDTSIAAASKAVRKFCSVSRKHGVASLDVFLTAPGRQSANAGELVEALERAAKHPVRVLTTEEEGQLAYAGAIATADVAVAGTIAVCDVGGASTEIAVGSTFRVPDWIESVDLGSVRLAARANGLAEAQREAAAAFEDVAPPRVDVALAVGGSARAVPRLVGPWLGEAKLAEALRILDRTAPRDLSRRYGVDRSRAGTLPGGAAILAQVQRLLDAPLHVCNGGIREGAVLATAAAAAA